MKNKAIIFLTFLTIILLAVVFVNSYAEAVFKKDNSQEKRRVQECQQNCNRNEECNRKSCNNQFSENYKNNHHRRNCNK